MIILPRFFFVAMMNQALRHWDFVGRERADDPLRRDSFMEIIEIFTTKNEP
jgi:hypothetical protein